MKNITAADGLKPVVFSKKTPCFHCHEPIELAQPVLFDGKNFCCEGCRTVFEILSMANLCQFYDLDAAAGVSQKNQKDARAWAFLDDSEAQTQMLQFQDEKTAHVQFFLPAMHCASCIWLLENLWKLDSGVQHSRADFLKKTVVIHFSLEKTSLRRLATLLTSIGYAPEIQLDGGLPKTKPTNRKLIYQIGVAGFAFGNIMLLSFPEYLGLVAKTEESFFHVFGWLNLFLALPVLLFSARDFFVSAWKGLKTGTLNLDLPIAAGAAMLFARSAFEIVSGTGAGYMDSFSALIFLLLIGRWFQQKAFHRLSFERDFHSYFPISALKKEPNGSETFVLASRLEMGDLILVKNGELIPADGVLLRGRGAIDYSFVTGEAEPQPKKSGDRLFAGGRQMGEMLEIALTRKPSSSYLTQLWNDEAFQKNTKTQTSRLAERTGKWFSWAILFLSATTFIVWMPHSMTTAINAATAVLMVACPCAAAIALPFTMGNVLRILGRNGFYLRSARTIEAFSSIQTIVFDKTGTLTNSLGAVEWQGCELSFSEKTLVKSLARQSSHPMSRRIVEFFGKEIEPVELDFLETMAGEGLFATKNDRSVRLKGDKKGTALEIDGQPKGHFVAQTAPRNGFETVLNWAKKQGPVFLLSGDGERERIFFQPFFEKAEALFFNQSPQKKLDFVKNLEQNGRKTLFLGDGLNDAGALQAASLGISVSENAGQFAPACDGILAAEHFEKLPRFVEFARAGSQIAMWSFAIGSLYNLVGLSWAVSGQLSPIVAAILMPISSVTVVLFGILSTNWAARRILN